MSASAPWQEQLRVLIAPRGMSGEIYATDANVHLAALMSLLAIVAVAGWLCYRPLAARRARFAVAGLLLLLAVAPALFFQYRTEVPALLLHPYELWVVLRVAYYSVVTATPFFSDVFPPAAQHRIAANAALLLLVLAWAAALRRPQSACIRWTGFALAVAVAAYPVHHLAKRYAIKREAEQAYAEGKALFDERCESARGSRTLASAPAEGITLLRIRAEATDARFKDRDWPDAGIPGDAVGQAYIRSFMDFDYLEEPGANSSWGIGLMGAVTLTGYQYVDVAREDGGHLRYRLDTTTSKADDMLSEAIPASAAARYAVAYRPNDTPQDREHWVAGGIVTVSNLATGDVLAEMGAHAFALPSRDDFTGHVEQRDWRVAETCPARKRFEVDEVKARMFAAEVVKPLYKPAPARRAVPAAPSPAAGF